MRRMSVCLGGPQSNQKWGPLMRVKRTADRIKVGDRRAGRDVGHALPKSSLDELAEFRVAAVSVTPQDVYAEGYRDALLDVVAGYSTAISVERKSDWPKHWREIWEVLKDPASVTEVAEFIGVSVPTASRTLTAMQRDGLLKMQRGNDSRVRRYERARKGM